MIIACPTGGIFIRGKDSRKDVEVDSDTKALLVKEVTGAVETVNIRAYDGTNWQNLLVQNSTYHNLRVSIYSGNNRSEVFPGSIDGRSSENLGVCTQTFLYGYNGSTWDRLRTQSATYPNLRVSLYFNDNPVGIFAYNYDSVSGTNNKLPVASHIYGFNGTSYDRLRTHYISGVFSVTATGTTSTIDTVTGFEKHTWQVISDASGSNLTVKLQGSIDNSNWFDLDEFTGVGNTMRHVVNKPVRYIRFNVTSMGDATEIKLRYFGMR